LPMSLGRGSATSVPAVGYGCWKVPKEVAAQVVFNVIKAGYR